MGPLLIQAIKLSSIVFNFCLDSSLVSGTSIFRLSGSQSYLLRFSAASLDAGPSPSPVVGPVDEDLELSVDAGAGPVDEDLELSVDAGAGSVEEDLEPSAGKLIKLS